jgi:hypothetical protein
MPAIFFKFGLRFYFVCYDCNEPVHVHIMDDQKNVCKYWLRSERALLQTIQALQKGTYQRLRKRFLKIILENIR